MPEGSTLLRNNHRKKQFKAVPTITLTASIIAQPIHGKCGLSGIMVIPTAKQRSPLPPNTVQQATVSAALAIRQLCTDHTVVHLYYTVQGFSSRSVGFTRACTSTILILLQCTCTVVWVPFVDGTHFGPFKLAKFCFSSRH